MTSRFRQSTLVAAAAALLAVVSVIDPPVRPEAAAVADALRLAYGRPTQPGERWRRHPQVRLPDGREVPRERAYRDDPQFVAAARRLLASRLGDDASLGAWLLGSAPPAAREDAVQALAEDLARPERDPRVAFEATLALSRLGSPTAESTLRGLARSAGAEDVRTAAAWASGRLPPGSPGLLPGFRRGVSWWMEEAADDAGSSSFRRLASLGVRWVSIHTWDPLQRGLHDPVLAAADPRFGGRDLRPLVRAAHQAGLSVMVKPHLEMRGYQPSPEEQRVLRSGDEAARSALLRRLRARLGGAERPDHGRIEMRSEADWQRWFAAYTAYLLPYARQAQQSGAEVFCVGREMDLTVRLREGDWRRLIARVRAEFQGRLTYSANFDDWQSIDLWDALDFIGVSAYFPLSERQDPSLAEIEEGWDRVLLPLETAARRFGRPVLLTEVGFPSLPSAARAPWREAAGPADVWLQARCYEATLRALSRRPWIEGAFFWLWEHPSQPPFRDPSHAIVDKPASFTLARWYAQ